MEARAESRGYRAVVGSPPPWPPRAVREEAGREENEEEEEDRAAPTAAASSWTKGDASAATAVEAMPTLATVESEIACLLMTRSTSDSGIDGRSESSATSSHVQHHGRRRRRATPTHAAATATVVPSRRSFPPNLLRIVALMEGNDRCVDCGESGGGSADFEGAATDFGGTLQGDAGLRWASSSFGTLLCGRCAFRHMSNMPPGENSVISLDGGEWTLPKIFSLLEGGNSRFWQEVRTRSSMDQVRGFLHRKTSWAAGEDIYRSRAARSFRKKLAKRVAEECERHGFRNDAGVAFGFPDRPGAASFGQDAREAKEIAPPMPMSTRTSYEHEEEGVTLPAGMPPKQLGPSTLNQHGSSMGRPASERHGVVLEGQDQADEGWSLPLRGGGACDGPLLCGAGNDGGVGCSLDEEISTMADPSRSRQDDGLILPFSTRRLQCEEDATVDEEGRRSNRHENEFEEEDQRELFARVSMDRQYSPGTGSASSGESLNAPPQRTVQLRRGLPSRENPFLSMPDFFQPQGQPQQHRGHQSMSNWGNSSSVSDWGADSLGIENSTPAAPAPSSRVDRGSISGGTSMVYSHSPSANHSHRGLGSYRGTSLRSVAGGAAPSTGSLAYLDSLWGNYLGQSSRQVRSPAQSWSTRGAAGRMRPPNAYVRTASGFY